MQDENERHNKTKIDKQRNEKRNETAKKRREGEGGRFFAACLLGLLLFYAYFSICSTDGVRNSHQAYFLQVGMSSSWRCIRISHCFSFRKQLGLLVVGRNCWITRWLIIKPDRRGLQSRAQDFPGCQNDLCLRTVNCSRSKITDSDANREHFTCSSQGRAFSSL